MKQKKLKKGVSIEKSKLEIDDIEVKGDIEEVVLKTILKKTGLIFVKTNEGMNHFVPDNLRELQNFLLSMNRLDTVIEENNDNCDKWDYIDLLKDELKPEKLNTWDKNIVYFEHYFNTIWLNRNLRTAEIEMIQQISSTSVEFMNATTLNLINEYYYNNSVKNDLNIADILAHKNILNINLGDVLEVLSENILNDNVYIKKIKFAIKVVYTIILTKLIHLEKKNEEAYILIGTDVLSKSAQNKLIRGNRANVKFIKYYNLPLFIEAGKYHFAIPIYEIKDILNKENILDGVLKYYTGIIDIDSIDIKEKDEVEKQLKEKLINQLYYISCFIYPGKKNDKANEVEYLRKTNISSGNNKTNYARFNLTGILSNILYTKRISKLIFDELINTDIDYTNMKYDILSIFDRKDINTRKIVFPIDSIDIFDTLNKSLVDFRNELKIDKDIKTKASSLDYFNNGLNNLRNIIENINKNNSHLKKCGIDLIKIFNKYYDYFSEDTINLTIEYIWNNKRKASLTTLISRYNKMKLNTAIDGVRSLKTNSNKSTVREKIVEIEKFLDGNEKSLIGEELQRIKELCEGEGKLEGSAIEIRKEISKLDLKLKKDDVADTLEDDPAEE